MSGALGGWRRQKLELCHRQCALAIGRSDAIASRISTADHDDVLAPGINTLDALSVQIVAGNQPVLLPEIVPRESDSVELTSGRRQIARFRRTATQDDGIERIERIRMIVRPHLDVRSRT
jgi:hypothetical protein